MATSRNPSAVFQEIELPDGSNPVSKGIIRRISSNNGIVTVRIAIDGLGEKLAERIVEQIRGAALALPKTTHVRVLPFANGDKDLKLPEVDHVLAVASVKGGVGKTTVAVVLARALSVRGHNVGLFDADIYGPNIPHLFDDIEGPVLTNDEGRPVPLESDGLQVLSPGVTGGDPPTARRGAIAYGAIKNLLSQGTWEDRDIMIIDMPAGSDDVAGAVLEHVSVDGAIFVTTPFDASVDDTKRTVELFRENDVSPIAAVVNMNSFECHCCGAQNTLFEDPVDIDVPVIHELPFDPNLQRNPGGLDGYDAINNLAVTVEDYIEDALEVVPEDALDLRGLPQRSQIRQLSDDLAFASSESCIQAVVNDPTWIRQAFLENADELLTDIAYSRVGSSGILLELTRR